MSDSIDQDTLLDLIDTDSPVILDVGCNDGMHSRWFLETFPNAIIFAFEPEPRAIKKFRQSVTSERVNLFEFALSNQNGFVDFYQSRGDLPDPDDPDAYKRYFSEGWDLSGSIRKPTGHLREFPWVKFSDPVKVPSRTLDSWASEFGVERIDFIWADVQGAEGDLIQGGLKSLSQTRLLYTEYSNNELYDGQPNLEEILRLIPAFEIYTQYPCDVMLRNCCYY